MAGPLSKSRLPIKYDHADHNLLLMLVGFALSVIATRSFLKMTGYPQIASGDFHIAHVLWGGLLLYVGSLILLIWRGRRIHSVSSLFIGIGFGLFIDEIGKFITRSNDYFFPLAAPLIYAFFLLSVLVYLWIRNQRSDDPSNEFYRILDLLERGIDPSISAQEQDRLLQKLRQITAESTHPRSTRLADNALSILEAETVEPRARDIGFFEMWLERFRAFETRWIGQTRFRIALILGFLFLALRGLLVVVVILVLMVEIVVPSSWQEVIATPWWDKNPIGAPRLILFAFVLFSEAALGLAMLAVTGLLLTGKVSRGITIGYWVLLFSLTALHLPVFYFEQFEGITTTLLQFCLLLGIIRYRFYFPEPMETAV